MEIDSDSKPYERIRAYKQMLKHEEASKILFPDKQFDSLDKESNKKVKAIYKIVRNEIVAQKIDYSLIKAFSQQRFNELKLLIEMKLVDIIEKYNISPVKSLVRKALKISRNAPAPQAIREEGKSASSEHESRERLRLKKVKTIVAPVTRKTDRTIKLEYERKLESINDNEKKEIDQIINKYKNDEGHNNELLEALQYLGNETEAHLRPPEGFTSWSDFYLRKNLIPKRQELAALKLRVEKEKIDAFNLMEVQIAQNHRVKETKASEHKNKKADRETKKRNTKESVIDLADLFKVLGGSKKR